MKHRLPSCETFIHHAGFEVEKDLLSKVEREVSLNTLLCNSFGSLLIWLLLVYDFQSYQTKSAYVLLLSFYIFISSLA